MVAGATYGQVAAGSTVAMQWLAFFSKCDYFDKHITIWDLIQSVSNLPPSAGECRVVNEWDVQVVAPFVIDFQTMRPAFVATPDYCEIAITCQCEDNLNYGAASSIPWMTIKGGASTKLVYLSEDPWSFSDRELDILLSVSPWPSPGCRPLGRWWPGIRRMRISG